MKKISAAGLFILLCLFSFTPYSQSIPKDSIASGGEYSFEKNDASTPCITPHQYEVIEKRCAENIKVLKLNNGKQKSMLAVPLYWPVQAANGLSDCSYYGISAYVDQNTAVGTITDYNCGTNTYDGHHGTDIFTFPFSFYKMDNDQVEVIAAAAGTIIDKGDGNFDKNCSTNSLPANYVIIQHSDGSLILYWHMKLNSVTPKSIGQTVSVGEYLGVVGSSGSSTGPHLHFEVWSGSTSNTYIDPYSGPCNTLNSTSWWASQKPYTEPAILKASLHTTDIVFPPCPATETLNESTSFPLFFQGPELPPGAAKFYIFMRNETIGTTVNLSILNPDGTTFNSWIHNCTNKYNASYWSWTKYLPTTVGTYNFKTTYNGITCSQSFDMTYPVSTPTMNDLEQIQIYPNPADGKLNIVGSGIDNGNYKFTLKNVLGQAIFEENAKIENKAFQKTFSISELPDGIYFMTIETSKTRMVKKIIKQDQ